MIDGDKVFIQFLSYFPFVSNSPSF